MNYERLHSYFEELPRCDQRTSRLLTDHHQMERNAKFQKWFRAYRQDLIELFQVFLRSMSQKDYFDHELSFVQFASVIYKNSSGVILPSYTEHERVDRLMEKFGNMSESSEKYKESITEKSDFIISKINWAQPDIQVNLRPAWTKK